MNNMPEILAPVGGEEQLKAAVFAGADAVYLGGKHFNARRNAQNFGGMDMQKAVSFCHARNTKVYITLNTLIKQQETKEVVEAIEEIAQSGADAVIVQDMGVLKIIKEVCPTLALHASTQMTITNAEGARMAKELGFSRAVVARELSAKEIAYISKNSDIELEMFVHGALCMSVSGQCYLSCMLGGRSGNRGLCAQPCRLNFNNGKREFALSLKDLTLADRMQEVIDLGVASLKIEGRMKRPEYVAASVAAIKAALEGKQADVQLLQDVFSRGGFTQGYFDSKINEDMFGIRSKDDKAQSHKGNSAFADYDKESKRIKIKAFFKADEKCAKLLVSDGERETEESLSVSLAQKRAVNAEDIKKNLDKTGGTPFYIEQADIDIKDGLFISAAEINAARRNALDKLLEKRSEPLPKEIRPFSFVKKGYGAGKHSLRIRAQRAQQISEEMAKGCERIILPIKEIFNDTKLLERYGDKLVCELPTIIFGNCEKEKQQLISLKQKGLKRVLVGNIGHIEAAREAGLEIMGSYALNIANDIAFRQYNELGIKDITLSFEQSILDLEKIGEEGKRGIISYGYLPLMQLRSCPLRQKDCGGCKGGGIITDRMNKKFSVLCNDRKYSTLLNSVPLYVCDKKEEEKFDFSLLYFTTESEKQCQKIFEMAKNKAPFEGEFTRGMYFKELI